MELVKDIILQITFIILPIFTYHLFWLSKTHSYVLKPNKILITCSTIISSLLCILWPIEILNDLPFNLQAIPLFVSFVYGGYIPGLLTLLTTFAYRIHFLDVEWFYVISSVLTFSLFPCFIHKKWQEYQLKKKLVWSLTYSAIIFCFIVLFAFIVSASNKSGLNLQHILTISISSIIFAIILLFAIYLIEYMKVNALMRIELVNAEKLVMVSELAASVAHEVRNPLTVVRGFVQLIGNSTDENISQKKEYMNLVLTELDRAQSIISDYLGLAGQQYISKEKFDLSKTLRETTELMISYANFKTVSIHCNISNELHVIGDKAKLKQVFINLIKNAIEAVPNVNGKVEIKAFVSHEFIRIKISDNGIGMSQEQIARLGEPYYTLKEKGTGLGLTVTFSIIKNHGGSIRYKSEPNKGTVVIITLPFLTYSELQS